MKLSLFFSLALYFFGTNALAIVEGGLPAGSGVDVIVNYTGLVEGKREYKIVLRNFTLVSADRVAIAIGIINGDATLFLSSFAATVSESSRLQYMSRQSRLVLPGIPHYITQRGNRRQRIH